MSSVVTAVRPCQAAWATAARAVTMSARIPSTSKAAHTSAIVVSWRSDSATEPSRARAVTIWSRRALLGRAVLGDEGHRVGVEGHPAADDLGSEAGIARSGDLDGQSEAVEQLRTELTLLGVHRADQDHPGGVGDGDALSLHGRAAHRGGVEQQVDEVVVEQVDLVDVEDAAVRGGQQARLVDDLAGAEGLLQVERADHAVLGGADRQLDQPGGASSRLRVAVRAVGAVRVRVDRVAAEPAAGHHARSAAAHGPERAPSWSSRCPSRPGPARRRPRARRWSGSGPGPCRRSRRPRRTERSSAGRKRSWMARQTPWHRNPSAGVHARVC